MSIIKQKHFMPRFYLGYGFIAEDGAKLDWEFSEVKSERFNVEYLSLSEHEAILSEERARLSELEKKFEKRLTGVIYELYAKEKSKEEFNALIDSALAKLKAKSSVGDEGDK